MSPFTAKCSGTVATHLFIGMAAASFWRGGWYVLDDTLFPDSPEKSAVASLGMGAAGMAASQGLIHRMERLVAVEKQFPLRVSALRFGALYSIAFSCLLVWRGTWLGWDCLYERLHETTSQQKQNVTNSSIKATDPGHATKSGLLSHLVACSLLLGTGFFASVLAPPAAASVIQDLAVKTGARKMVAPAQSIVQQLFGGGRLSTMRSVHHKAAQPRR